jgi:hypothetical protein
LFLLIAAATLGEGCGGHEIDRSRFKLDVCTDGQWKPLQRIKPAPGVDGVQLRSGVDGSPDKPRIVDTFGTICGGAKDPTACAAAIDALHDPNKGWMPFTYAMPERQYLVSTSGDTIAMHTSVAETRAAFGAIDTPEEAAFIATIGGGRCRSSIATHARGSISQWRMQFPSCGAI